MRALNAQFELFDTSYVPVGNWNGGMQQGSKLAGRESARKYKNSGNEAKKWLKTKGITFFDAANCAHFTRKFAPIERCMEQKRRVLSKTKLRLRRGQARQESDRKSATSPADLAASVPTAPPWEWPKRRGVRSRRLQPFAWDWKAAALLPHSTAPTARFGLKDAEVAELKHGVGDGIRTRDVQIHSLALYQLSYTHRNCGARRPVAVTPL
jgi:hypothetical protein